MFVKDWMTKDVVTVGFEQSLLDARKLLHNNRFRHLPVLDGDVLVGMLTQSDLLTAFVQIDEEAGEGDRSLAERMTGSRVRDHMSQPIVTVPPEETLEVAALTLRQEKIGALPVVSGDHLLGILTETDIFSVLIDALGLTAGGARMVFDLELGRENEIVSEVVGGLTEKGLRLTSLATYHPRDTRGAAKIVVRARGESPPE